MTSTGPAFGLDAERFVFAYGSLVDPSTTQGTLGRPLAPGDGPTAADLVGYRRAWNTASGSHSHPERRYVQADGSEYDGLLAVLGLAPDPGARCNGAVLRVTDEDLRRLARRERNYEIADATDLVRWDGRPQGCVVHVFVPRRTSVELLRRSDRAVIRQGYARTVERAFDRLGSGCLADFRATTAPTDLPRLELTICSTAGPTARSPRGRPAP